MLMILKRRLCERVFDCTLHYIYNNNNLQTDYTSVLKAIKVADSFFYNPGTGPIELPFQFAFDACLRIKHKKRKSKKSNKKPCNESQAICPAPYLKQVPESAVQINNTEQTCSDFLANFQYPQSKNSDQFDRRAVAGSVCSRHGVPIPRTFSNVYCGEA